MILPFTIHLRDFFHNVKLLKFRVGDCLLLFDSHVNFFKDQSADCFIQHADR